MRIGTFFINLSVSFCAFGMMLCGYPPATIADLWNRAHKSKSEPEPAPEMRPVSSDELEGLRRAYWLATQRPQVH